MCVCARTRGAEHQTQGSVYASVLPLSYSLSTPKLVYLKVKPGKYVFSETPSTEDNISYIDMYPMVVNK